MNLLMLVKGFVRQFGYDVRRYHALYDTVLKRHDIKTVLDIGANDGEWSHEMRVLFPDAQIYAFEPLTDCFERLTRRFNGDRHFRAFPVALSDVDGSAEIERSSFHPSSSLRTMAQLHKDLYPKSAAMEREKVTVRRLDSLGLVLTPGTLVKMDVQGFEDKVIAGGKETISKAQVVIAETSFVELYEGQPLFGNIHDALRALGFTYRGNGSEHFSRLTGERIYEDSIFVRQDA